MTRTPASALFVTPNTLRTHLRAIYHKLGAESPDDAVIRAREPTCGVTSSAGRPAS
jgi:DNA-binding CsgD family transcriptional regulator